jgi:hypothetical protein
MINANNWFFMLMSGIYYRSSGGVSTKKRVFSDSCPNQTAGMVHALTVD